MDSESDDVFSHFAPLDELIQVIYQGSLRFVVLSAVNEVSWTVHVGLCGTGRWWRGRWKEKDVRKAVKTKPSKLNAFTERLANHFVQGELHIGDWSPDKGAQINFSLDAGNSAKTPVQISLVELSHEDAASFATTVFAEIAIQAQSSKCRLHPSPFKAPSPSRTTTVRRDPAMAEASGSRRRKSEESTEEEVSVLKAELAKARDKNTVLARTASISEERYKRQAEAQLSALKAKLTKTEHEKAATDSSKLLSIAKGSQATAAPAPKKGASLANPGKKARKYQAIEFGSDDE